MAAEAAAVRPVQPEPTEDTEAAQPEQQPAPAGRRKLILLAAPLLLGLAGGGLWFTGMLARLPGLSHAGKGANPKPVLFPMPELVANLNGGPSVERYVKVDIRLVVANPAKLSVVRANLPQLQDLFLTYLRDMHPDELQSSTGTWRLREALLNRAAVALGSGLVTNVLFTNLLIQ